MSTRNLEFLLKPRSVAVIGASDRSGSVGAIVMHNLRAAGFAGPVWGVNVRAQFIDGHATYGSVAELPGTPELAVICTPAPTVPALIAALGTRGTRAAVVISAGLEAVAGDGRTFSAAMLAAARPHTLRILGPNCVGLLVPRIGLNASFAHVNAPVGGLAFVAQSGALLTAMLDWAQGTRVGFSHCVSLGNSADIDFGDLLDYLATDSDTTAILLYIESITDARKFMAAARAAARNKPVIVVRSGRVPEGARAASSHTGAMAGADDVYDAAFRRAGLLRVDTTQQLFDAAETLAHLAPIAGERLAIVSNGGGPGVMATDALIAAGGRLATLMPATLQQLDGVMPGNWSRANPVDIIGDAPAVRYVAAIRAVLTDPGVDAALLIHAPTAIVPAAAIADAVIAGLEGAARPLLTCWMGGDGVRVAADRCAAAGLAVYRTPEDAVGAFLQVVNHHRNQRELLEMPAADEQWEPDAATAQRIIDEALHSDRTLLSEAESKQLLAAYGIAVVATRVAPDVASAAQIASAIGYPVALKILSPDITHKSDVGGVALDLRDALSLEAAANAMLESCRQRQPAARLAGFTVQPMIAAAEFQELIAGITVDRTFGPVVLFGQGGTAVEVIADQAVALPPLNDVLALALMTRTRVFRLLQGYRNRPPADLASVAEVLVKLARMACELPEVQELDINPLLAGPRGVLALDARVRVAASAGAAIRRLAIRPYPRALEQARVLAGRQLLMRPICPQDLMEYRAMLQSMPAGDRQMRFFRDAREPAPRELAHFTQIDYERDMTFVALEESAPAGQRMLGVVQSHGDPDGVVAEFALLVRGELQGQGLGTALVRKLIGYTRDRGVQELTGEVDTGNTRMVNLARDCGFDLMPLPNRRLRASLRLLVVD